ncbi:jerky protein homolog-like [Leptopilina boulardi]|uniref:jerky protein homolog-like n=1 Tax=Leptopilina boulardi TaxID=63433 RepID=UPI0021F5A07C|nr:jerky protein homolog-like [Leptopilina boulardi]
MNRKRKKTFLNMETKAEIIKKIKLGIDKEEILHEYEIGESSYYKFLRTESKIMEKLKNPENKHRRLFKKLKNEYLDAAVIKWFQQSRDRNESITGPLIRDKAKILNQKLNGPLDFKASSGWLTKFKKRYNIRLSEMKDDEQLLNLNDSKNVDNFANYLQEKILTENLLLENIYNADEAGIYWRTLVTSIITNLSKKKYENINFNDDDNNDDEKKEEDCIAALFCSNAAGNMRTPLLIIGKTEIPDCLKNLIVNEKNESLKKLQDLDLIYTNQENASMTQKIFRCWFEEIFIPQALNFQQELEIKGKILLILDNAPCHPALNELNSINKNIEVINLPCNLSSLIQPINQEPILLTKKYYKTNLLRNLLYADKIEGIEEYLKNFNYLDSFLLLKNSWTSVNNSTLKKVWKSLLGELLYSNDNNQEIMINNHVNNNKKNNQNQNSQQLINDLEFVDVTSDHLNFDNDIVKFPQQLCIDLCRISSGNYLLKNFEKIFRNWYENDDNNCGWQALSDDDIVNCVQKGDEKKINEVQIADSENSCGEELNLNNKRKISDNNQINRISEQSFDFQEIKSSDAYKSLKIIKMWIYQSKVKFSFDKFTLDDVENMLNEELE